MASCELLQEQQARRNAVGRAKTAPDLFASSVSTRAARPAWQQRGAGGGAEGSGLFSPIRGLELTGLFLMEGGVIKKMSLGCVLKLQRLRREERWKC